MLVVEDETALATALAEGLRQDGFSVETVGDGLVAWDRLLHHSYDLVLLDLMLPGLGGLTLCARLRDAGVTTPVLVLTARTAERDQLRAFDTGADDFLAKPFSYRVLLARIRALTRRSTAADAHLLVAGDLVLDRGARRCRRGAVDIELTPREFALLELLMARAGHTVGRRAALDEVWDFALDDESKVLDVYIGYLRRKVDLPFARHTVQTVRGVGYRLDPKGG
ncbi:response regulator transcription factor [Streptomyces sp. So13.3]|nr:response regulator transcription factor [Streptomyces sp. So13.3]